MPRRRRASTPIDESTWQGRLRRVAVESDVSPETVAAKVGKASTVTIYEWERPNSGKSPNPQELAEMLRLYGASADYVLLHDESKLKAPEMRLVAQLAAVAEGLDLPQQRALVALAEHFLDAVSAPVESAPEPTDDDAIVERVMSELEAEAATEPDEITGKRATRQSRTPRRSRASE